MKVLLRWACLFVLPLISLQAVAQPDSPNILIIYADDMGFGDLACQNEKSKIPTPNLDQLASEGMRFVDGHSSSGICTPSRYALLTGRYHWRKFHGIVNVFGQSVFSAERLTLPEMLKEKGYTTGAIGKWHLGWDWASYRLAGAQEVVKTDARGRKKKTWGPEAFDWSKPIQDGPLAHGFDYYFGDTVINFPPYCWIENDKVVKTPDTMMDASTWPEIKEGNWECRPGPMVTGWNPYENIPTTTQKGVEFIHKQKKSDQPFFLYFAFPSPHAPIIPNDEFDGKSQAGAYGDFVYETDDACGQLLKALKESGQAENTLVIFTADNGPENYTFARDEKFDHWSSGPLRGRKRDIYEGGHHVPFIVRWPGVTEAGAVSDQLVGQIDIMATCAATVGYDLPADQAEDSQNMLPILKGEKGARSSLVHNTFDGKYAVRAGDWVLINHHTGETHKAPAAWMKKHGYPENDKLPHELYNLAEDLGQRNNLANQNPERVEKMKAMLKKIQDDGYSAPHVKQ